MVYFAGTATLLNLPTATLNSNVATINEQKMAPNTTNIEFIEFGMEPEIEHIVCQLTISENCLFSLFCADKYQFHLLLVVSFFIVYTFLIGFVLPITCILLCYIFMIRYLHNAKSLFWFFIISLIVRTFSVTIDNTSIPKFPYCIE